MDKKFSAGDSNSDAYRDNWDRVFGEESTGRTDPPNVVGTGGETPDVAKEQVPEEH